MVKRVEEGKEAKCGKEKWGVGVTNDHRGERLKWLRRKGRVKDREGGTRRMRRRLSPGDKRVSPETAARRPRATLRGVGGRPR